MSQTKVRGAVCCALFGLVLLTAGFVLSALIAHKLHNGIVDGIQIKSPQEDKKAFKDWQTTTDHDDPITYWHIHFFNLLNLPEVLNGSEPVFGESKLYTFRKYEYYFNATFSHNEDYVAYNERTWYEWLPEESTGHLSDQITNIWPSGLTALNQAGGTTTDFVGGVSGSLLYAAVQLLEQASCIFGPSPKCILAAAQQWGTLDGKLLGTKAGESVTSNPAIMDILKTQSPVLYKMVAFGATQAAVYPELAAFFKFNPDIPAPLRNFTLSADVSEALLLGSSQYPCPLTNSTAGPGGVPCAAFFLQLPADSPTAAHYFPIDPANATSPQSVAARQAVALYLVKLTETWMSQLAGSANSSLSGMLWTTRTPLQWIFQYNDPLLELLALNNPSQSINSALLPVNQSSNAVSYEAAPGATIQRTGKRSHTHTSEYVQWEGYRVLPPHGNGDPSNPGFFCNGPVDVFGHDDDQFPPSKATTFSYDPVVTDGFRPFVWVDQLFRPVVFSHYGDVHVKGIPTKRFHLDDYSFEPNKTFSDEYFGLVNMTCVQGGVPVMLTLPHYLRARFPESWKVQGVSPPDPEIHETFLDVDPITGATLRGYKRLQINFLVKSGTSGLNGTKLVPVLWLEETSQLTNKDARKFKDKVLGTIHLNKGLLFGLTIGGGFIFLVAACVAWSAHRKSAARPATLYTQALLEPENF